MTSSIGSNKKILVTGAAGFIGFHLSRHLLRHGYQVQGIDNFNSYYAPQLKRDRVRTLLTEFPTAKIHEMPLESPETESLIESIHPDIVIHLAAQAGVRHSIENPWAYVNSNLIGFQRVLESVRKIKPLHFIFASSSSVYGTNSKTPYSVDDRVDHPVSMYAVTKRSNELMGQVYSEQFGLPTTALRFFTVYGSWGRPDMAYFSFTKKILKDSPLEIYNNGNLRRDFTHISDIVEPIKRLVPLPPHGPSFFRILNIGASSPVELMDFVHTLEDVIGKKAELKMSSHQLGDVFETYADVEALAALTNFRPQVKLREGLNEFYQWFSSSHALDKYV